MKLKRKLLINSRDKYITTAESSKLIAKNFAARLAEIHLVIKADFDDKLKNFNKKNTSNKTKHLQVENELKKLQTFD